MMTGRGWMADGGKSVKGVKIVKSVKGVRSKGVKV